MEQLYRNKITTVNGEVIASVYIIADCIFKRRIKKIILIFNAHKLWVCADLHLCSNFV